MSTTPEHPAEQVLVIPANLAEALCNYKTFGPTSPVLESIILQNHSFREREEAEKNFEFKQVIPYVMVLHTGACAVGPACCVATETKYLLSQRTSKQQEARLHNKYSLGQGGHINDLDMGNSSRSPIMAGLLREVAEEFHLGEIKDCAPIGTINDNSSEVSRVHFGLVYMVRVDSLDFSVAEAGKHTAQWATKADLEVYYDRMENWSQVLMDHVIAPA